MTNERTLNIPADYFVSEDSREYVGRQWQRLCGELEAAEQHVKILRDQIAALEPKAEPLPAGYIECDNCKSRFLADRGGESCVACGHTLNRPAEPRENPQWAPEEIEKAMKQWSGIPLCPECFRPQLYCACAIMASLRAQNRSEKPA